MSNHQLENIKMRIRREYNHDFSQFITPLSRPTQHTYLFYTSHIFKKRVKLNETEGV